MAALHLPADYVLVGFIPYHCKLKGDPNPPEPEIRAKTAAEAVRHFVKRKTCPRGAIVQVFTPETIRQRGRPFEYKLQDYGRRRT